MLTSADKVGGSKKGQKHADVLLEWSVLNQSCARHFYIGRTTLSYSKIINIIPFTNGFYLNFRNKSSLDQKD